LAEAGGDGGALGLHAFFIVYRLESPSDGHTAKADDDDPAPVLPSCLFSIFDSCSDVRDSRYSARAGRLRWRLGLSPKQFPGRDFRDPNHARSTGQRQCR